MNLGNFYQHDVQILKKKKEKTKFINGKQRPPSKAVHIEFVICSVSPWADRPHKSLTTDNEIRLQRIAAVYTDSIGDTYSSSRSTISMMPMTLDAKPVDPVLVLSFPFLTPFDNCWYKPCIDNENSGAPFVDRPAIDV